MRSNIIKLILRILVAAVLLYIIFSKADLPAVFALIKNISLVTILSVLILNFTAILISAYKWKILLPDYGYWRLLSTCMAGRFYSFILPGQLVGEVAKTFHLAKGTGDGERIAATVIIDKITGLIGIMITGVVGLFFSASLVPRQFFYLIIFFLFALIAVLYILKYDYFFNLINRAIIYLANRYAFLRRLLSINTFLNAWKSYLERPGILMANVMLGIIFQLIAVIFIFIFSQELNIGLGYPDYCWVNAIMMLAIALPITIAGLGLREGVYVGLLGWLGVSTDKALALSLSLFALQIFDASIGGAIFLSRIFKSKFLNSNK